jgi:uncharacterized protein (DUF2252 family)
MESVDVRDDDVEDDRPVPAGMRLEHGKVVPHLTVAERDARGKAARREVPRESHAAFTPGSLRPDPVELLERQAVTRVSELVPLRYGRMLVSPFTFYRGGALIMASDLAGTPRSGLTTQVCGDAHLMNFGAFGSPERQLVFGINDFDETYPGPWEWDVKRLAASFAIAGRDNGYTSKERRKVLLTLLGAYRSAMRGFAGMTNLAVWYSHMDVESVVQQLRKTVDKSTVTRAEANIAKARSRDSIQAFAKLTQVVDGEPRIISDPPLIQPIEELFGEMDREQLMDMMRTLVRGYRRTLQSDRRHLLEDFRLAHVARKVVGVGSVGTRAWILLMLGRDERDPLFLQAKEAEASVLEQFVGAGRPKPHGARVVHGQHLMQESSDIFLGWQSAEGADGVKRDFYVRQLRDWKGSAIVEAMNPAAMAAYSRMCGWTIARAHARSGDRIAIAAYLGARDVFDQAIAEFSETYADQNERDYDALVQAEKAGRITAHRGL